MYPGASCRCNVALGILLGRVFVCEVRRGQCQGRQGGCTGSVGPQPLGFEASTHLNPRRLGLSSLFFFFLLGRVYIGEERERGERVDVFREGIFSV